MLLRAAERPSASTMRLHLPARLALDRLHIELTGNAAVFAFDYRLNQPGNSLFALFEQMQTRTDHVAGGAVPPAFELPGDEAFEMIAEGNADLRGHGGA